jgi:hypothetical protein
MKAQQSRPKMNGCAILILLAIGIGITFTIFTISRNAQAAAPFKAMKAQLHALCTFCSGTEGGTTPPSIVGKVVVIDSTGAAIGFVMANKRLAAIRAYQPDDVSTVILVGDIELLQFSTYSDGANAYIGYRDVCIIDLQSGKVLTSKRFHGSKPASSKQGAGAKEGSDPINQEIIEFILALTVK